MSRDQNTFPFPDTDTDTELHTASATAYLLDELVLHGHRPGQDEPDPRPLPEPDAVRGQLDAMVEAFSAMLTATRLEDDLADVLWSFVNLFHRKTDRIERELDTNEQAQRRGQAEQDGSEVKSVELERLIEQATQGHGGALGRGGRHDHDQLLATPAGDPIAAPGTAQEVGQRGVRRALQLWHREELIQQVTRDGGYRITGKWRFMSGSQNATWLGAHLRVAGTKETKTFLYPKSSATFHDIWHTLGLRGTASNEYSVDNLFIPHERAIYRDDPRDRRTDSPLYRFTSNPLYSIGFGGVSLGIARGPMDVLLALPRENTRRGAGSFRRPSVERMEAFTKVLQEQGIAATLRISKGQDIAAGCGQLKVDEPVAVARV